MRMNLTIKSEFSVTFIELCITRAKEKFYPNKSLSKRHNSNTCISMGGLLRVVNHSLSFSSHLMNWKVFCSLLCVCIWVLWSYMISHLPNIAVSMHWFSCFSCSTTHAISRYDLVPISNAIKYSLLTQWGENSVIHSTYWLNQRIPHSFGLFVHWTVVVHGNCKKR